MWGGSGRLFEARRLFEVGANSRLGAYSNKYGTYENLKATLFGYN